MKAQTGDKVRLKGSARPRLRGVIEALEGGKLVVRLEQTGERIRVMPVEVTNLSLAARRAWVSMPNRRVGRPKGLKLCDRVSVTLRIDRDVWERFRAYEAEGTIENRTATINCWFRKKLQEVGAEGAKVHAQESK